MHARPALVLIPLLASIVLTGIGFATAGRTSEGHLGRWQAVAAGQGAAASRIDTQTGAVEFCLAGIADGARSHCYAAPLPGQAPVELEDAFDRLLAPN